MAINLEELYRQQLEPLPPVDRLKLITMLAQGLTNIETEPNPPRRSLMELHGLGKEIWQGVDAQEYVNSLREEWDQLKAASPRSGQGKPRLSWPCALRPINPCPSIHPVFPDHSKERKANPELERCYAGS